MWKGLKVGRDSRRSSPISAKVWEMLSKTETRMRLRQSRRSRDSWNRGLHEWRKILTSSTSLANKMTAAQLRSSLQQARHSMIGGICMRVLDPSLVAEDTSGATGAIDSSRTSPSEAASFVPAPPSRAHLISQQRWPASATTWCLTLQHNIHKLPHRMLHIHLELVCAA